MKGIVIIVVMMIRNKMMMNRVSNGDVMTNVLEIVMIIRLIIMR